MKYSSHVAPEEIQLDPDVLERAYRLLDEWTTPPNGPIPAAALVVGRHGKIVPPRLFGRQTPDENAPPIREDATFLLASITKPITYLAGMILVERGLLNLADKVTTYIPEFAAHHKEETLVLHLFTHTSGLPDMLENNAALRANHAPLAKFAEHVARDTVPLFPPGTNLSYQSMGTLMVAEIIQRITGLSIHEFMKQEIFDRLQMSGTSLGIGKIDPKRSVHVKLPPDAVATNYHWNTPYWQALGAPWGGMFSTPEEFARICQMMLGGGIYRDERIVSPATIRAMTTNRLDDLPDLPEPLRRTQPWGLGWRLNHPGRPDSWGQSVGEKIYGHVGATGTIAWIDPVADAFMVLFTTLPLDVNYDRLVRISNIVGASIR